MQNQQEPSEEKKREILKEFNTISSEGRAINEARLFELLRENIANVRNAIVISGVLASIGLLVLNNQTYNLSLTSGILLQVSIIAFLLAILIYSFYLKNNISEGLREFTKALSAGESTADKGRTVIKASLDNKITQGEYAKQILEVYNEFKQEGDMLEARAKKDASRAEYYLSRIGNTFYVAAVSLLVLALLNEVVIKI